MDEPLIRPEAVEHQAVRSIGSATLPTPLSHGIWVSIAISCVLAAAIFGFFGHYTKRASAQGMLVPPAGVIDVRATDSGTISDVNAKEGTNVETGASLVSLSRDRSSTALGATAAWVAHDLNQARASIEQDIRANELLEKRQAAALRGEHERLEQQREELNAQIDIQLRHIDNQKTLLQKVLPLQDKGYVSGYQIHSQREQLLEAEARHRELVSQRLELIQRIAANNESLEQLPITNATKRNELSRQQIQLNQSMASAEADREIQLKAPRSGVISAVLVKQGDYVTAGQALVALLPGNAELQARLFVPSRSIGLVHEGTPVALRLPSFPYQKFGFLKGKVCSLSKSSISPADITSLTGKQPPEEDLYRLDVCLAEQSLDKGGKEIRLMPGMAVEADLLLERRTLAEWLFEPLIGASKRMQEL